MLVGCAPVGSAGPPRAGAVRLDVRPSIRVRVGSSAGIGGCRLRRRRIGVDTASIDRTIGRHFRLRRRLRSRLRPGANPRVQPPSCGCEGIAAVWRDHGGLGRRERPDPHDGAPPGRKYQPAGLTGGTASSAHHSSPSSKRAICRPALVALGMVPSSAGRRPSSRIVGVMLCLVVPVPHRGRTARQTHRRTTT